VSDKRWLVQEGDGATVGAIVGKAAPGDASAIAEGRVFVGKRRALDASEPVTAGDDVTIADASRALAPAVRVLKRGKGWFAVDKPAGIATIPDHGGASNALLPLAARAVGLDAARLHATSRLDREVSGVVVFATTPDAAARLKRARDEHAYVRRYVALAARAPGADEGTWDARIGRAKDARRREVNGRDATDARTHYAVVARADGTSPASPERGPHQGQVALLALAPVTGRTHQLRVHAAHAGAPLLGDRVYGGPTRWTLAGGKVLTLGRIYLHAARVTIEGVAIDAAVPEEMRGTWGAIGGRENGWAEALARTVGEP
jgi:23S rRNA-/tRNA-specific pseudouridylate synthase